MMYLHKFEVFNWRDNAFDITLGDVKDVEVYCQELFDNGFELRDKTRDYFVLTGWGQEEEVEVLKERLNDLNLTVITTEK